MTDHYDDLPIDLDPSAPIGLRLRPLEDYLPEHPLHRVLTRSSTHPASLVDPQVINGWRMQSRLSFADRIWRKDIAGGRRLRPARPSALHSRRLCKPRRSAAKHVHRDADKLNKSEESV